MSHTLRFHCSCLVRPFVLTRDGYRCVLTGMFDDTSAQENRKLEQLCVDLGAASTTVEARHISNGLTMQNTDPAGGSEESTTMNKVCRAATAPRP